MSRAVAFVVLCSPCLIGAPLLAPVGARAAVPAADCGTAARGPRTLQCPASTAAGRVVRDVPYVQPADSVHTGDLYLPGTSSGAARPAVVVIHGGGWSGGSKESADTVYLSQRLAGSGYVAFNVNYRLIRQGGSFPNDVQDVKDAVAFLGAHARQWQIDTHRIAVTGTSAGGHLSLMAAYTPNTGFFAPPHYPASRLRVAAVGDFFGPADLAPLQRDGPGAAQVAVQGYVRGLCTDKPATCREASPVTYVDHAVPTLIEHGTADGVVPFSQSQELAGLLRQHRIPVQLVAVPGGQHGLMLGQPGPQRASEVNRLLAFLRTLGSTPSHFLPKAVLCHMS